MKKIIGFYRKCDLLTMSSTILSLIGIVFALKEHFTISIILLLICGLCDGFDGALARKYKYSKEEKVYGAELDSLSDVLAFGIYPAILTIIIGKSRILIVIAAIFYLLCSLVRLAYFNMLEITKEKIPNTFIGVPITTVAIVYPLVFYLFRVINYELIKYIMPILLVVLGISFVIRIKIPKPDIVKLSKQIFNKYVINLIILPLVLIVLIDMFYKFNFGFNIFKDVIISIESNFSSYLLIYILVTSLFVLLTSILGNSKRSVIATFIIVTIILFINDVKYKIMGKPLEISDVAYLNPDNMAMMGEASGNLGSWIIATIIKTIGLLGIGYLFVYFNKKNTIKFNNLPKRIGVIASSLLIFLGELVLIAQGKNALLSKVYKLSNDGVMSIQDNASMYYEYGFSSGLLLDYVSKETQAPTGYEKATAQKLIEEADTIKGEGKWGKPNVVFILSEAFTDVTNIKEIEFNEDVIPNIHKFAKDKNSMVMDLNVNTFGGASVNTEFEILTGATLSFFRSGFIPYNSYYTKTYDKAAPSIINELNNNGYETMYITPWGADSYHSREVYNLLGTTETRYDLECEAKGYYCGDENLMDIIYKELEDTNANNLKFIMTATGENHWPFDYQKYNSYDLTVKNSTLDEEGTQMLTSYAQGIYDADKSLNYLYEKIKNLKTPTLIVFFGDHLPLIVDSKGNNLYLSSSFLNTENPALNYFREYMTKAVILANYPIATDDIKYLNANYLGSYVLNKMDLDISGYFKFIDEARKALPVFNRAYNYNNGEILGLNEMNADLIKILNDFKYVEYYSFYDNDAYEKSSK